MLNPYNNDNSDYGGVIDDKDDYDDDNDDDDDCYTYNTHLDWYYIELKLDYIGYKSSYYYKQTTL